MDAIACPEHYYGGLGAGSLLSALLVPSSITAGTKEAQGKRVTHCGKHPASHITAQPGKVGASGHSDPPQRHPGPPPACRTCQPVCD
jgi:hypothetical protein